MRSGITLTIIFIVQAMSPAVGFGVRGGSSGARAFSLPWLLIAKKVHGGSAFCGNECSTDDSGPAGRRDAIASLDPDCNYGCPPGQPMTIKLPSGTIAGNSLKEVNGGLAKWTQGSWKDVGKVSASIKRNQLKVTSGIEEEGFFRLQFTLEAPERQLSDLETYAIVYGNWRRDILAFCRELKEQIESNPDPKLIFSSIAVSHFDHTMELVDQAPFLSAKILTALADSAVSKDKFEGGECPDLVIGLNKISLKRFAGAMVTRFAVFVPENYDSSRKWPLYLQPDGKNFYNRSNYSHRSGLIDMWWHVPGYTDFEWRNYQYVLGVIKSQLNLDADRFYLYGHCGNGIAAMALALNYPDHWAECGALLGNSYRHLAGNALNLPLIFIAGNQSEGSIAGYIEFPVKCFEYYGCRHFRCGRSHQVVQTRGASLPEAVRQSNPRRVLYTIDSLGNPKAYWVKILGREDENLAGTIDASVDGQTILVKTRNISAYRLDLIQAPVDLRIPVEIVENGRSLGHVRTEVFTSKPEAYAKATYVKNEHLHGPVWDAFTDPYVVAWGSGSKDRTSSQLSKQIAESLARGGPCFADVDMPEELVGTHNLILVGTVASNLWLSKISKDLPVQIRDGQMLADGKCYAGPNKGFILIYPNPLNPEKYVAVFSAISSFALGGALQAYSEMKSMMYSSDCTQPSDVGIFEVTEKGEIRWHRVEKLSTMWDWHSHWKEVLVVTNKKHLKWHWRQWVARALRLQLEADVVVCEDPFKFSYSIPSGQITYRDLFNSFRNDWIVKIKLAGQTLRNLVAARLNNTTGKQVSEAIIDGVSFTRQGQDHAGAVLGLGDLEDDKYYTAALASKLVNGEKLGTVLRDYEIIGEGYLVPLLAGYLRKNKDLDIDAELDNTKFIMF